MKVAFDENMPIALVRVFKTFAGERQLRRLSGSSLIVESALDYVPKPGEKGHGLKSDVPWIRKFAEAGGKVVISGNTRMRQTPFERLALIEAGMIVVFFENRWNGWNFFRKCALLLHWWPVVAKKLKTAKPKEFWCVPCSWDDKGKLRPLSNEDQRKLRMERQIAAGDKIREERARKRAAAAIKAAKRSRDLVDLMHERAREDDAKRAQQKPDEQTEATEPSTGAEG